MGAGWHISAAVGCVLAMQRCDEGKTNNKRVARDGDLPPDTPSEAVMAAVRQRGFGDDSFWNEVCRLRQQGDAVCIFNAFQTAQPLRFPGDILSALMKMQPYPIPANRVAESVLPCTDDGMHPGPIEHMSVGELPEGCRVFELNTDWKGRVEFERPPSGAFVRLLDQIGLGFAGGFAPPFTRGVEAQHFPWTAVARLSNSFAEPLALEVLRDWGVILRKGWETLDEKKGHARSVLAVSYQRAYLRWLVQRLAFERLR